ncbi:MAG TPA: TPM domain-containing protein, partial [Gemmatimonadales bacterium]|nr:TPM domain-containing protein [Gemmatimonadales bacterium]
MRPRVTFVKAILLVSALQGAAAPLAAQREGIAGLFPPQPAGYVTDATGTIDAAAVRRIDALAERLKQVTGAELAVAVLPTIGDYAAVDVAVAIGRAWGVGARAAVGDQTRNAGLVILLVPRREDDPNSGQIFIATGQGLEGIVTDYQAGRVRDLMRPLFQRGDYAGGLEAGAGALAALIAKGMGLSDSALMAGDRLVQAPAQRNLDSRLVFRLV